MKLKISSWFREYGPAILVAAVFGLGIFRLQSIYLTSHIWQAIGWGNAIFILTILAWVDYRQYRLPNGLLAVLLVNCTLCLLFDWSGIGTEAGPGFGLSMFVGKDWVDRFLGIIFPLLLILLTGWIRPKGTMAGLGAGDGKLFLILGFWLGFNQVVWVLFLTMLFVIVVAFVNIQRKKATRSTVYPLGPAILAACMVMGCL